MKLDAEDISPYVTALSAIIGSVVVAPFLIAKDKVTSTLLGIWKNPEKEYPCQIDIAKPNSCNLSLSEYIDDDGWNVVTVTGDHSVNTNT